MLPKLLVGTQVAPHAAMLRPSDDPTMPLLTAQVAVIGTPGKFW